MRRQISTLFAILFALNAGAWGAALLLFYDQPARFGTALIAYGLGLRHAVDADHIAAIDGATRKLTHQGRRPADVGLYFSLGHSSVVILLSLLLAAMTSAMYPRLSDFAAQGAIIGTAVSVVVLVSLGIMNFTILHALWGAFGRIRAGRTPDKDGLEQLLKRRGLVVRLTAGLLRLAKRSWHMYFIGLLFGLGFDTATEIALLGLSASGAAHGVGIWTIMVYPALFTAAMSLVDTADSVLMTGAFRWALADPSRRLVYNMVITALSGLVALLVGGVEAAGTLVPLIDVRGRASRVSQFVADHLGSAGYGIVAAFLLCWGASALFARVRRRPTGDLTMR